MRTSRLVAALSLAGAMSLVCLPVQAAPLTPLSAAAKPVAQGSDAIQVRWGGWHGGWHGGGWGLGFGALAAGALIGAAISAPYAYGGYYGGYPYYGGSYDYPAYSYSYGYPYGYGYSTAYYPTYSYGYYRPYRRYYVGHRPYWRNSYGMYRVHHYRY